MLKKRQLLILTLIVIFTISGIIYSTLKRSNYHVETIIKDTSSYVQSITTITTNHDKLNNLLKSHIEKQKDLFLRSIKNQNTDYLIGKDELNIDYQLNILDKKTWNITLTTTMSGPSFNTVYNNTDCWTWDLKKDKELNIKNVIEDAITTDISVIERRLYDSIKNKCNNCITNEVFKQIFTEDFKNFQVTEDNIIFYFNNDLTNNNPSSTIMVSLEIKDLSYSKVKKNKAKSKTKIPESKIIDPNKPAIALTFDDGPSKYTEEIINILKYYDVNASFFILGNKVVDYQSILQKSIENGNELGNHSYNHKWLSRLSINELINQIEKTQTVIKDNLNYTPRYLRPTYGSITNQIRKNSNLEIVLWTVDTRDWKYHDINQIITRATKNIKNGDIILMHDIFKRTADAVKKIIPILKEQGFQFVTVSELEAIKKIRKIEKDPR